MEKAAHDRLGRIPSVQSWLRQRSRTRKIPQKTERGKSGERHATRQHAYFRRRRALSFTHRWRENAFLPLRIKSIGNSRSRRRAGGRDSVLMRNTRTSKLFTESCKAARTAICAKKVRALSAQWNSMGSESAVNTATTSE